MSLVKCVFVPRWLDRVAKEVGVSNDDLISIEKLSCILSKRDLELYQMANFEMANCLVTVSQYTEKNVKSILQDLQCPLDILPLEQRAGYMNVDVEALVFGPTATRKAEGEDVRYSLSVEIADQDTLLIRVVPSDVGQPVGSSFAQTLAEKLHAMMDFCEFVRVGAFKQYVRELQIN